MRKFASYACLAAATVLSLQTATAATRLPFRSSFETGSFSEWNGGLDASMTVSSSQASEGRYSAQAVMTRGTPTDNYKEFVFGDHVRVNGTPVTTSEGLWLSFDSKFDTGFSFGTNTNLHKVAIVNFEDENGRRRYQLLIQVWTGNRQYFIEHLKWNADRSFNRALPGMTQNVGTPAAVRLGQWDKLKLFIKPNTPGQSNGIVRLWVNGTLKAEYTNVAVREDTSINPNKLLMSNYAQDTTTAGTQRWDNFYLGTTDPEAGVRPNPPVLESVN